MESPGIYVEIFKALKSLVSFGIWNRKIHRIGNFSV